MKLRFARLGAGVIPAVALAAMAVPAASAATTPRPLPVSLSASGTGASAAWTGGSIVLTVGSPASSTYAQMAVKNPGASAPASPPSFTVDHYAAGSPRWVLSFSDGCYIFGYPAQLGATAKADFTGQQWEVNGKCKSTHGMYETYSQALADVSPAGSAAVTGAYIVADGDQAAGTADTLSAVQYNGQSPVAPAPKPSIVITASAKCGTWKHSGWSIWYHPAKGAPVRHVTVWNIVRGHLSRWDTSVRRTEGQFGRIHARNGAIAIGYWANGKYTKATYTLPGHLPAC